MPVRRRGRRAGFGDRAAATAGERNVNPSTQPQPFRHFLSLSTQPQPFGRFRACRRGRCGTLCTTARTRRNLSPSVILCRSRMLRRKLVCPQPICRCAGRGNCLGTCCLLWNADVEVGIPTRFLSPRIPRRALFGDQVIGYDSEEQETDSDHPSVPSLLTVSETEDEADSADDGATDNATDNESDTDSDYDSLPSLLTESKRYSPARNLCTRDLCAPCTHTRHGELARAVCPQGPHQHPPHPPRSPRLPYTPRVSNCVFRLCMCRSVSVNTVVVLSPGDDGVYNTDDDLNDGWVLVEFNGNSGFVLCRSRGH